MASRGGRCMCVLMMVVLQYEGCVLLEIAGTDSPILSLCETENSRTSFESVVIYHPVHKTYGTDLETAYTYNTIVAEKKPIHRTMDTSLTKNWTRHRSPSSPRYPRNKLNTMSSSGPGFSVFRRPRHDDQGRLEDKTNIIKSNGSRRSKLNPNPRWTGRQTPNSKKRDKRAVDSGSVCSCSIYPRDQNAVDMSVGVTFYRLTSDTEVITGPPGVPISTQASQVTCPKLSLVFNGSNVQPLACLGLESKSVTSFHLPPIRLTQLGIKLESESGSSDKTYYAAFVVNVTVAENIRLVSSCNPQSQLPVANASEFPKSTTMKYMIGNNTQGNTSIITGVSPTGASMNNEQRSHTHGSSTAHQGSWINPFGTSYSTGHETIVSSPSSSPSSSLTSSTEASLGYSVTPALNKNGSDVIAALEKPDDDDDDSSRVLVAVLTSLIVISILCGLVLYLCRMCRLRYQEEEDRSPTSHRPARPYRVISLSRLLHQVSSQGTRPPNDLFKYPPIHSSSQIPGESKRGFDMNNERDSHLTTGRNAGKHHQENGVTNRDRRSVVPTRKTSTFGGDDHSNNTNSGNCTRVNDSFKKPNSPSRGIMTPKLNSTPTQDNLLVPPPVPARRKQNNGVNSKQCERVPKINETGTGEGEGPGHVIRDIQPIRAVLPTSGIQVSNPTESQPFEEGNKLEDVSDGKYSVARETSSVRVKRKNLGRLFIEFWSSSVFGRIATRLGGNKERRRSEDSSKIGGYWMPGDVVPAPDDVSSDGYESYASRPENMSTQKGCYRSYDSCDNYEVAKVYVHNDRKENDKNSSFNFSNGKLEMQDFESISDGYDNFMIAKECGNLHYESTRNDNESTRVLNLKSEECVYDGTVNRTEQCLGARKNNNEGFIPKLKEARDESNVKDGVLERIKTSSITIPYAEPKGRTRYNHNISHEDINDGVWQKEKLELLDLSKYFHNNDGGNGIEDSENFTSCNSNKSKYDNQLFLEDDVMSHTRLHLITPKDGEIGGKAILNQNSSPTEDNQLQRFQISGKTKHTTYKSHVGQQPNLDKDALKAINREIIFRDKSEPEIDIIIQSGKSPDTLKISNADRRGRLQSDEDNNNYPITTTVFDRRTKYVSLLDSTTDNHPPRDLVDQSEC